MPEIPVGAKLFHFSNRWLQITSDAWVHSLVTKGLTFQFEKRPPLSRVPIELVSRHPHIPESILGLLEKQAVERVQDPYSPGFYSRLFLVQKKNGSWRPVIDLKVFNMYLLKPTFKMETPSFIRESIKPLHWGVSLDLEDAYFHVPIHPNYRKYLRFAFQGQVYQFRSMPFGLATAPRVFTKLMSAVGSHLRVHGIILLQYFDDWLLHQLDRQLLLYNLEFSWKELLSLGLLLNADKSDLIPSQDFTFVGMNFLTHINRVRVSIQRISDLLMKVNWVLSQSHITAQEFLSLNGILSSVADFVQLGRLFLRPLQHYLSACWKWSPGNLLTQIPILPSLRSHLQWWLDEETLLAGVPLLPPQPSLYLITDASKEGWGAHLEPLSLIISGLWSHQESHLHINNLEMRAVFLAVSHFQSHLRDSCVMVSTDNTSVVAYIQAQGGTHSQSLYLETRKLLVLCKTLNIHLLAKYIPGRLNALADGLSRKHQLLPSEWTLHQEVTNQIFFKFGYPLVDLFATRHNHRLPLYVSPVYDPAAWAIDALSFAWDQLDSYAYPPPILIPQILGKIRVSSCRILLIAPWWPRRSWFNDLLSLLYDYPRNLPHRSDLLSQSGRLHADPKMFHLHVWPLSGNLCRRNVFLSGLQPSLLRQGENPPEQSMMLVGNSSPIGVFEGKLIPSIPLLDE